MHFFKKIRIILKSIQSSLPSESKKVLYFIIILHLCLRHFIKKLYDSICYLIFNFLNDVPENNEID